MRYLYKVLRAIVTNYHILGGFTVLENRSLKSKYQQGWNLLEALRETLFMTRLVSVAPAILEFLGL